VLNIALTLDGSGSFDPDGGLIAEYNWNFGDGNTGTGLDPVHTYINAGTYTVTLVVVDDEGVQSAPKTTTAVIALPPPNLSPEADAGGPYNGTAGDPVKFDGSASSDPDGTIVRYNWDFGDDSTGAGVDPTHTYTTAGSYTVTLIVVDEEGAESAPSTTEVEVTTASSDNGGCSVGGRGVFDPALPLLVLVALLYLNRRRVCRDRICDRD
jgi:PKD repeat protein